MCPHYFDPSSSVEFEPWHPPPPPPQDVTPYATLYLLPLVLCFSAMKLIFHQRFLGHFSCWRIGVRKKVSNWPQHNKYLSISLGSLPIGSSLCTLSSTCFAAISPFPCLTFIPHLSIYPSHLICCTICAAVISRAPHVLSFTPLISIPSWFWLTPSPGMAPLLGCLTDLFASHDGATMQSNPLCTKKKKKKPQLVLSHSTFCRHAAPVSTTLLSSPGESTLKAEMWWPYTLTTYKMHDHSQLHQNKSVSLSEWRACSPNRTIQVLNNSRLLIWASNHTDTSLSWVMEKWAWWKKILYAYGVWD